MRSTSTKPMAELKEDRFPTSSELRSNSLEYHRSKINSIAGLKAHLESFKHKMLKASKSGETMITVVNDCPGESITFYLEAHGCRVEEDDYDNGVESGTITRIRW